MDHRWYTPDEPWPVHDKPWWAEALREARDAGWHLRTFSGHTWGKVVCDRDATDAHQMLIFSTGRGGENAAKQLEKVIRRCQHTRDRAATPELERAERLLDGAATLLDAAELLLSATNKRDRAEELLVLAEQALARASDSDVLLNAAVELDAESSDEQTRAAQLAASAGYSPKRPHTEAGITTQAELRVDQAEALAAAAGIAERIVHLRERAARIRAQL